jgi:peptidoglycan/LPS O-acetylase OafA/YrhL
MSTLLETVRTPHTRPTRERGQRIPTLDGWRGVAILLVMVNHATLFGRFKDRFWAGLGPVGVDIFFVLSGYIITRGLIGEQAIHGKIDLRSFYVRRAFRILPLVVVYLSVLCLISRFIYIGGFHWQEFAGSLFFFRDFQFATNPRDISTNHFWSLSIEEHFYLVWPAILLWLRKGRALWFAIICAAVSALWRLYELRHDFHLFPSAYPGLQVCQTDARLDGLFLGAALAILLTSTGVRAFILANFQRETPVLLLPTIALNFMLVGGGPSFTLYLLIATTIAYTLIVKEGPIYSCLNLRPLVWIGEISYSLYIWQQIFLIHPVGLLPLGRLNVFPFNIACALVVATCSFYFIERPAIKFGRRLHARMN